MVASDHGSRLFSEGDCQSGKLAAWNGTTRRGTNPPSAKAQIERLRAWISVEFQAREPCGPRGVQRVLEQHSAAAGADRRRINEQRRQFAVVRVAVQEAEAKNRIVLLHDPHQP